MGEEQIDESAVRAELDALAGLLGKIISSFGANVLQGPAAQRLADGMYERRQDLVSLLASVSDDVARVNKSGFAYRPWIRSVPPLPRGSRWVQIEPEAAERLQREMGSEADGFIRHGRRIRRLFAGTGGGPGVAACERTAAWCREQERDLRSRVEYARASRNIPFGLSTAAPGLMDYRRGMVTIPDWIEFGPQEKARLAELQGRRVAAAFGAPTAQSRQELASVAASLRAHQNDAEFLAAFWRNVGPQRAATLASLLNKQDRDAGMDATQVFSEESRQILTAFAASLATATKPRELYGSPGGGAETASALPEFRAGLVEAAKGDMWSAGMLFKYGPKGDQWDPDLLSGMTAAVMAWRKTSAGQMPPNLIWNKPEHGVIEHKVPADAWYLRVGLGPGPMAQSETSGPPREQVIADFDPGAIMLARLLESPSTARQALAEPSVAHNILMSNWVVPAFSNERRSVDKSGDAGKVLALAVQAKRGDSPEAKQAAQAVLNILAGVQQRADAKPPQQLPPSIQASLRAVAKAYLPDLANSLATAGSKSNPTSWNDHRITGTGIAEVDSNNIVVTTFLKAAFTKPEDIAYIRGRVQGYLVRTMHLNGGHPADQEEIDHAVQLLRIADNLYNADGIDAANKKDMDIAEKKAFVDAVCGGIADTAPGRVGTVIGGARKAIELAQPFMDSASKAPTYESIAKQIARQSTYERQQHLRALVVQALILRGEVTPPHGAEWYQNQQVIPGAAFTDWYREHAHEYKMANGKNVSEYAKGLASDYQNPPPH